MSEESMLIVVTIPVLLKVYWYFVGSESLVKCLRMNDIVVVGYTTIFSNLLMVCRQQEVRLIPFAKVRGVHRIIEMRCALVLVISATVEIIKLEACTKLLACVYSIIGCEVVFAISLVASVVVSEVGVRRKSICKLILLYRLDEEIIRLSEDELLVVGRAVDEDTRYTRCTKVARRIIFSAHTSSENAVHKHVRQSVDACRSDVAKFPVDIPHLYSDRYLFVRMQRVAMVSP